MLILKLLAASILLIWIANFICDKSAPLISAKVIAKLVFIAIPFAAIIVSLLKSGARTHYLFIIPVILVPALIYLSGYQRTEEEKKQGVINYLFSKNIWLHKSAYEDYWIILINAALIIYVLPHLVFHPSVISNSVASLLSFLPIDNTTEQPGIIACVLFIVASFAAPDFMYYWAHRLLHEIPVLWQFHKVHHSAEVMTPLTLYRIHPVEVLMTTMFRAFGLSVAAAIFFYIYPNTTALMTIAGTNIIMVFTTCTTANLRHSHFWLSFGPNIEKVIMSPTQHQIHHSTNPKHFDKNYGSDLSLWDWLYGTEFITEKREDLKFGISEKERSGINNVMDLYVTPFNDAINIVKRNAKKRKNKSAATRTKRPQTSDK